MSPDPIEAWNANPIVAIYRNWNQESPIVIAGDALVAALEAEREAHAVEMNAKLVAAYRTWNGRRFSALDREREAHAATKTALADLIGWIIGSDCYKHLPDAALKKARAALGDTPPSAPLVEPPSPQPKTMREVHDQWRSEALVEGPNQQEEN